MSGHRHEGQELDAAARAHVRECAPCANALIEELELKRAIAAAGRPFHPPEALRARVARSMARRRARVWPALAAAALIVIGTALLLAPRRDGDELVDMHVTMLASANPVDVMSTDRHTVKPWFEGRIPFSFPIPELSGTPFRLIGGRVVYWHQQPGAYLLLGKDAHRVSLFVFRTDSVPRIDSGSGFHTRAWRAGGAGVCGGQRSGGGGSGADREVVRVEAPPYFVASASRRAVASFSACADIGGL